MREFARCDLVPASRGQTFQNEVFRHAWEE